MYVQVSFLQAGLLDSIPLVDCDLASVGLKDLRDKGWLVSFGNGIVTTRSVSPYQVSQLLERPDAIWDLPPMEGVVTAVKGNAKTVTRVGAKLEATPNVPVDIAAGWHYTVSTSGDVFVAETNPVEWVIAIQYMKVKSVKTRQSGVPKTARMPGKPDTKGSDVENTRTALVSTSQKSNQSLTAQRSVDSL